MAVININVFQYLPIVHGDIVDNSSIPQVIDQSLLLSQTVHSTIQLVNTNQPFNVQQVIVVAKTLNFSVTNVLNINQFGGPTYAIEAQNVLHPTQLAAKINPQQLYQSIHLIQNVIPSRALENFLTITQTLTHHNTLNIVRSNTLVITQSLATFKTDAVDTYAVTVPDPINPIGVILSHGTQSVILTIPEIGDVDKIDVSRVQEQTRGGDLIIFRDPVWPITEILRYKFIGLTRNKSQALLKFFADTIGLSIQLSDYQGIIWNGIILTPEAEITCSNDNNCGTYEIEFEFQGEMA